MNKAVLYYQKQVEHVLADKQVLRLLQNPFIVRLLGTYQTDINLFCVSGRGELLGAEGAK